MSEHHHFVRHMVDSDVIRTEFRCDAPEMASCRAFCQCVRNGSEYEYCSCDEPVLADVGYCNILAFLQDAPDECFNGTKQSARTGWSPITLAWEGDYFSWDYAEVAP